MQKMLLRMLLRIILSICLLCGGLGQVLAQSAQVSAASPAVSLTGHLWASAAQGRFDSPEQALQQYRSGQFEKLPGNLNRGYRTGSVWLAFELQSSLDAPERLVLEVGPAFLDHVTAWQADSAGRLNSLGTAGDDIARNQLLLPAFKPSFPVSVRPGQSTTLLLQIESTSVQAAIVKIYHEDDFPLTQADYGMLLGVIFTVSLVMVLVALAQYAHSRNSLYMLWLAYLLATTGQWFMEDGLAYHFVNFAELDRITNLTNAFSVIGQSVGAIFVTVVFRFKSLHARLHGLFIGWAIFVAAAGLFAIATNNGVILGWLTYFDLLIRLLAFVAITLQMVRNQGNSLWFGPWFLLYMSAGALNQMASIALIPYTEITFYGWQLAGFLNLLSLQQAMLALSRRHAKERTEWWMAQLTRQNADLEAQVTSRTESLSQALRDLQQAESEQRQLLSMASHEFRTPAAMIKATLDSLNILKDRIPPEVNSRLGNLRAASLRLAELSNSLISQDRLHELSLKPRLIPMNLLKLVQLVLSRYPEPKPQMAELPDSSLVIHGDESLLSIALHNLIDNALRYGNPGDGTAALVTVSVHVLPDKLELQVADNGPGIPDEEKEAVFQRFHAIERRRRQADTVGTSQISSGLGLSIVKSIVLAHGGQILVRDRQPHGSVLVICLPLA